MLHTCDHYLSYTQASTTNLIDNGFDSARITTLNNAVELLAAPSQLTDARREPLQVLFVASLVDDKEPLTAVAIVNRLRYLSPGATLHIAGDGPLRPQCEDAASRHDWVHYHGPKRGNELRHIALASDLALLPGRVGLAIIEMASVGLPLATLATSLHGAEISYLRDGVNGLFLSSELDKAAKELDTLLTDRSALGRMRTQALAMAEHYTVQSMAANYANGVIKSLC
jgi:glycosyltransferase involved in cell wall biosynthesis